MQISTSIPVHLLHADPVVNMGLKALCRTLSGLNLSVEDEYPSAEPCPAILLADYHGGMELIQRIKSDEVRVLIITHCDKEGEIRKALQSGIHGYVLHNCVLKELAPAIAALSNGSHYLSARATLNVAHSWSWPALTDREVEVLRSLGKGQCNKLIARELGIHLSTVKCHMKSVMAKLSVSDRVQAVIVANQRGLLAN
jgi:DNA-binding NarL/FixJ family response regulator